MSLHLYLRDVRDYHAIFLSWLYRARLMAPSSRSPSLPTSAASTSTGILLLPDEVLARIFQLMPASCGYQAAKSWEALYAVSNTCRKFRSVLALNSDYLAIHSEDSHYYSQAQLFKIVKITRQSLRVVHVARSYTRISTMVETLPPSLRELRLTKLASSLTPTELLACIRRVGENLCVIEIQYFSRMRILRDLLLEISRNCTKLTDLSLDNLWMPVNGNFVDIEYDDEVWVQTWEALGGTLRSLSFTKTNAPTFNKSFIYNLSLYVPKLTALKMDAESAPAIPREYIGIYLGELLTDISIVNTQRFVDSDALTLLTRCKQLCRIHFENTGVTSLTLKRAIISHGSLLERIALFPNSGLQDNVIRKLESTAPNLTALAIRRSPKITCRAFTSVFCSMLLELDLRDCPGVASDELFHNLANGRSNIRVLRINECNPLLVSQKGIERFLKVCGSTLEIIDFRFRFPHLAPDRAELRRMISIYCRRSTNLRVML